MGISHFFALFLFISISYAHDDEVGVYQTQSSSVLVLNEHSFPLHVVSSKFQWIIEFVEEQCPTCLRLRPKFEESAERLQDDEELSGKLKFGRVICTVDKPLCRKLNVDAYPTILYFRSGNFYEYIGSYEAHKLKEFATEKWKEKIGQETADADVLFPAEEGSDVVTLNEVNFLKKVSSGDPWFVKFYAPWCGHCKRLEPVWEQFATSQKGNIKVARVDCTVEQELGKKFGVRGYPSLKLIRDGWVYDYRGNRTEEDLLDFATSAYAQATYAPLPYSSPSFNVQLATLTKQAQEWAVSHPTEAHVLIGVVFLLLGLLLGKLTASKKVLTVTITKSSSTLPAAPAPEAAEKEKKETKKKK